MERIYMKNIKGDVLWGLASALLSILLGVIIGLTRKHSHS